MKTNPRIKNGYAALDKKVQDRMEVLINEMEDLLRGVEKMQVLDELEVKDE